MLVAPFATHLAKHEHFFFYFIFILFQMLADLAHDCHTQTMHKSFSPPHWKELSVLCDFNEENAEI